MPSRSWFDYQHAADSQLNALTASSGAASETLVRLRAAQAAYFRFGLLLELHVTSQALRGAAEFAPTFTVQLAVTLHGICRSAFAG